MPITFAQYCKSYLSFARSPYISHRCKNVLGKKDQFRKYRHFTANTLSVKYDYMSIMHYGKDYFAKLTEDQTGYLTTVEALNEKYADKIGQRKRVTSADAGKVNILYGCAGIRLSLSL